MLTLLKCLCAVALLPAFVQAATVQKDTPAWGLLWLLADFSPPAGCTVTPLLPDGSPLSGENYTPGGPFKIQLTMGSQTDFVDIPADAIFTTTLDEATSHTETSYSANGKTVEVSMGATEIESVQVGTLLCR